MDIMEEKEVTKKCFKFKERLFGHLNVAYNESNSLFIFWNKYQIFVHEDQNFESPTRIIVPEFQIRQLIAASNYLICLDCSGNVHVTSLRFKHSSQKRFKSSFQPKGQGILCCVKYSTESVLSLKEDAQTYFLCLNKIRADFQQEKKVVLEIRDWPLSGTEKKEFVMRSFPISKEYFTLIREWFHEEIDWKNHHLILISFDKLSVFACLFSHKDYSEATVAVRLYTCPTEICDFSIVERNLSVLIGLGTGTLLIMPFKNILTTKQVEVIHLNAALSKFITIEPNDSLIYTDGVTFWKSEQSYNEHTIQFTQFFTKYIKDFIKFGDQLICTTYSNIIYKFSIERDSNFVNSDTDSYCPAEKLLHNSDYLLGITREIERNKEIINKINEEENYITAISLSKRPDLMNSVIQENIVVYENFIDVQENKEIVLTEELAEYFRPESLLLLIQFSVLPVQHTLSSILTSLLEDLTIHITFLLKGKALKTTSLRYKKQLKKLDILIPLSHSNITKLNVEIKFICKVPGVLDKKQVMWIPLHKKNIDLNAEHFIKVSHENKIVNLKEPQKTKDEIIQTVAENQHGDLVKITDLSKSKTDTNSLIFYVKLPDNYKEIFKNENYHNCYFNSERAAMIRKQMTSEEFLKSKSNLIFEIGLNRVHLEIINDDFFNRLLKVTSEDGQTALDIRNFFANVVHQNSEGCESVKGFVSNSLYTTTENLLKALKKCVPGSEESILSLSEQFQKNVVGALPI